MSKYWVINWELKSFWVTDDINDINEGCSYRYENDDDLIQDIQDIIREIKK